MISMGTAERAKKADDAGASVETHGAGIAKQLEDELAPYLEPGEEMPDVQLFMTLIARRGRKMAAHLKTADEAHESELADDPPWRAKRDAGVIAVRAVMTDLRDAVTTGYGADVAALLGLEKPPSYDATLLAEDASSVADKLRDPEMPLPEPRRRGMTVDRAAFAEDLEADLAKLEEANSALRREGQESDATLTAKHQAMRAFDEKAEPGFDVLTAIFELGGRADLADRMLPAEPRRRKKDPTGTEPTNGPPVT